MTDNKLTDNEIKKALEEKIKALKDDYKRLQLLDAPMDCFEESHTDNILVLSNALDLINRLQAKIEKLEKAVDIHKSIAEDWKCEANRLKEMSGDKL